VIPLPVYLTLLAVIAYFVSSGNVPTEINMMIALLAVLGFTCAELGHRVPLLKEIGGAAILATFVPSFLNYHHWIPAQIVQVVTAGGVGEGGRPLSIGYGQLWHQPQGELFAQVLPPVMFGSLTAILLSGILSFLGRRFPELTGEGRLQPEESEELATHERDEPVDLDVTHIAGAGLLVITLYLLG